MCGSGYPTYPKFVPTTQNCSLQILKLKENSRTKEFCSAILFQLQKERILFCYSLPTSELGEKIHFKMTFWKGNLNFYALKVKWLKQGYIFYISFVLFYLFSSRSEYYNKKKMKNSILPTYPKFFQGVAWTTHIFLFGLIPTTHDIQGEINIDYTVFLIPALISDRVDHISLSPRADTVGGLRSGLGSKTLCNNIFIIYLCVWKSCEIIYLFLYFEAH